SRGFTAAQLYSTASYQNHDLSEIRLRENNLSGWNFAGQNLADADCYGTTLTGATFTGAEVRGANFSYAVGFTAAQLYSTASYQHHDISGVGLAYNNLNGGKCASQQA